MEFIIHRGSHEVGGSCIEVFDGQTCLLLDLGLPLNSSFEDEIQEYLPQPLFGDLISGKKTIQAVFLSHAHLDHYGLIQSLPGEIQVFCGRDTAKLIDLSSLFSYGITSPFPCRKFTHSERISVGNFVITPYLMDHSAFDAYAFLVENRGQKLFYTGDFRGHGRKSKLFNKFVQNPPTVDFLLMEGTRIGPDRERNTPSEADLEEDFVKLIHETQGLVLVTASSQNIDRLVTIFRAARRTRRIFVIDIYTAEVLDCLEDYPRLPKSSWGGIRVSLSGLITNRLKKVGRKDIIKKHEGEIIEWPKINERKEKFTVLIRGSMIGPVKKHLDLRDALWIYSMWDGYLERGGSLRQLRKYLDGSKVPSKMLHTSGHASFADLKRLANSVNHKVLIPIHTDYPELFKEQFQDARLVSDGEPVEW